MNDFYTPSGIPSTGAALVSATPRAEFALIGAGFDKLPALAGNGSKLIAVNSGGTALEAVTAATVRSSIGLVIGTDVQAWDADLDAIAGLAATAGMLSRTGAGAFAVRTITGTANEVDVANGSGASAAPTISLPATLTLTGKAVTADTQTAGDNSTKVATTAFVTAAIPPGVMYDYAGTSTPSGFLPCDGAAVSRSTYAALFTAIGTTWGVGNGSTTFNVPNFKRRVAVGSGGSGTATLANSVGSTGGEENHTLTTAEMPSHTHSQNVSLGAGASNPVVTGGGNGSLFDSAVPTQPTGGNDAHNVIQPSAVVLKIIKT